MKRTAPKAMFDDVNLVLKLYDIRREPRLREARRWFTGSFKARTVEEFLSMAVIRNNCVRIGILPNLATQ